MSKIFVLEPADIKVVKNLNYRNPEDSSTGRRKIVELLERFIEEGHDCCRIAAYDTNQKAHCEATIVYRAILAAHLDNTIKIVRRGPEIYLVNKHKWESLSKD